MRKVVTILIPMLAIGATAYAANVHLKPPKKDPTFIDQGLTLKVSGALAGLGNGDVVITLIATAEPEAVCINPGGGSHEPPGQNPAETTVAGATAIPESEVKNGNTPFAVTTDAPVTPIPGAPACPNPNWSEEITEMAFTSATITVDQGGVALVVECTFAEPTSNGVVDRRDVSCQTF